MAINACVRPLEIEGVKGVTAIEVNVATVTFMVAEPDISLYVAVIVVVPIATLVATPEELIVAIAKLFEDHIAVLLISRLVPSENVPVAIKV